MTYSIFNRDFMHTVKIHFPLPLTPQNIVQDEVYDVSGALLTFVPKLQSAKYKNHGEAIRLYMQDVTITPSTVDIPRMVRLNFSNWCS